MKKILLYFFGICCIVSSIIGFSKYGIANGIICIIIGVLLISAARGSKKTIPSTPADIPPESNETKSITFPVAGVTFKNDDGSERQLLLRKIYFHDSPFDEDRSVALERYFWHDEPAYYVKVNGFTIGNVPAEFVPHLEINYSRHYFVEYIHVYGGNGKNFGAEVKIVYDDLF